MHSAITLNHQHRILVIDDDPLIHEALRRILCAAAPATAAAGVFDEKLSAAEAPGFQVDSAFDAQEGLEKFAQALGCGQTYASAFVNVGVPPGWEGVESIARILELDPRPAVFICSHCSDDSAHQLIGKLGNGGRIVFLQKPFDSLQVLQLVHTLAKNSVPDLPGEIASLVNERTRQLRAGTEVLAVETARREFSRQALEECGERLSEKLGACALPIAVMGLQDHRCVEVNRAYLAATGRSREEVIGRSAWETGVCIDRKARLEAMGELAHGRSVRQRHCRLAPMDGGEREALIWIEPFDRTGGRHLIAIVNEPGSQHAGQSFADVNSVLTSIAEYNKFQSAKSALDNRIGQLLRDVRHADELAARLTRQLLASSMMQAMESPGVAFAGEVKKTTPVDTAPVVLLVDDDEDIRCLAREVLQEAGYRIIDAADGHQAIAAWRGFTGPINLLLTDMVMPGGLSGTDVAECFKLDRPDGRILFSSGYNVELFGSDSELREGVNYLPKPYFARQLLEAVARSIHGEPAAEMQGV